MLEKVSESLIHWNLLVSVCSYAAPCTARRNVPNGFQPAKMSITNNDERD